MNLANMEYVLTNYSSINVFATQVGLALRATSTSTNVLFHRVKMEDNVSMELMTSTVFAKPVTQARGANTLSMIARPTHAKMVHRASIKLTDLFANAVQDTLDFNVKQLLMNALMNLAMPWVLKSVLTSITNTNVSVVKDSRERHVKRTLMTVLRTHVSTVDHAKTILVTSSVLAYRDGLENVARKTLATV